MQISQSRFMLRVCVDLDSHGVHPAWDVPRAPGRHLESRFTNNRIPLYNLLFSGPIAQPG